MLEFEGQEGLHGDMTDSELRLLLLEQLSDLPFALMRREWIADALSHERS